MKTFLIVYTIIAIIFYIIELIVNYDELDYLDIMGNGGAARMQMIMKALFFPLIILEVIIETIVCYAQYLYEKYEEDNYEKYEEDNKEK